MVDVIIMFDDIHKLNVVTCEHFGYNGKIAEKAVWRSVFLTT